MRDAECVIHAPATAGSIGASGNGVGFWPSAGDRPGSNEFARAWFAANGEDVMANNADVNQAAQQASSTAVGGTAVKNLYEIGEIPPLGHVPKEMYAWCIRQDREGPPDQAMQVEVVPTWELDSHDVLVLVMAAGVNYNGVWASLGTPVSMFNVHKNPFHVAGSDASGIFLAVGSKVNRWKVGDEVVIHCNQDGGDDEE